MWWGGKKDYKGPGTRGSLSKSEKVCRKRRTHSGNETVALQMNNRKLRSRSAHTVHSSSIIMEITLMLTSPSVHKFRKIMGNSQNVLSTKIYISWEQCCIS